MNNKIFCLLTIAGGLASSIPTVNAVDFSLFADISFEETDVSQESSNFAIGGLDFFATQQINDNTSALVELVFENDGSGFIVDLERLWIRHTFSDQFQVAAGRFHSPLGYWNRNYHHGAILQDTIGRPFFLDFEDGAAGILPVHSIGVMINGIVFSDSEDFKYEVILSNGPSLDSSGGFNPVEAPELDPNNISDNSNNKSIATRITYNPEDSGWTLGLFGMLHDLNEAAENGVVAQGDPLVEQQIYGADFRWEYDRFDLLTELYSIQNKDSIFSTGNHDSFAFFVQPGYRLTENTKLIYRYSDLSFENDDSYFLLLGTQEQSHHVVTLRYDVDAYNTIKFEFDRLQSSSALLEDSNSFRVQWSVLVP